LEQDLAADFISRRIRTYIAVLLLTTARRAEAGEMRWSELSPSERSPRSTNWRLPAARNKTKEELLRPLSAAAVRVLASVPRVGEFVFRPLYSRS
jgi:integrase